MRTLHVASPLMRGEDVLAVQQQLHKLGFAPGPLDGRYGPTTFAAVKSFQGRHHIVPDGVVGPVTLKALAEAVKQGAAHPPITRSPSSTGQKALAQALLHLGVTERPPGSNMNPFGKWFGVNGVPWCAIFVSECFELGAGYTLCQGFHGAGCYPKGCTYVPTLEGWLRASGHWVGRTTPLPGDVAIFNWDGGVPDHVGLVEKDLGGGTFQTVEGNTAVGNDSNGGQVMRRLRYVSQVDGFGRIR